MGKRVLGGTIAAATVAVVGGCSLLVDTDAFSGGGGGYADAATPPREASASTDAGAPESGVRPGPCSGTFVHCETFDTADSLKRYGADLDSTTSIDVDDVLTLSPPRSAKFVIAPSNNTSPDATLMFTTATPLEKFVFEGNVHIEREEPDEPARLLRVEAAGGPFLNLSRAGGLSDGTQTVGNVGPFPVGRWVRIRFEVTPPTATITVEGADPGAATFTVDWETRPVSVKFGVSEANSPTTGWIVRWDDLVLRAL